MKSLETFLNPPNSISERITEEICKGTPCLEFEKNLGESLGGIFEGIPGLIPEEFPAGISNGSPEGITQSF